MINFLTPQMKEAAISNVYSKPIKNPDMTIIANNDVFGDKVIYKINLVEKKITQISISVEGCLIVKASANLLADYLHHKDITRLTLKDQEWLKMLNAPIPEPRQKCALLPLKIINQLSG